MVSAFLVAQNTVEDLNAIPVVPHLSPSVIDMPIVSATTREAQNSVQQDGQVSIEKVNGVMRKKVKRSKTPKITKLDKEARKVKDLEPAGLSNF